MTTTFYPKRKFSRSCAFCHEAGHHVRDCTTLANTECKYCHNLGHTTRRCPVLAERDMNRRRRANAQRYKPDNDGFSQAKNTFRRRVNRDAPVMSSSNRLTTFSALAVEVETEPKKKSVEIAVPAPAKQLPLRGSWKKPLNMEEEEDNCESACESACESELSTNSYHVSCACCDEEDDFEDLQDAYDNGWFQSEDGDFCPEHAAKGIEDEDNRWKPTTPAPLAPKKKSAKKRWADVADDESDDDSDYESIFLC